MMYTKLKSHVGRNYGKTPVKGALAKISPNAYALHQRRTLYRKFFNIIKVRTKIDKDV